jgi:tellurite resistance protein TerC
MPPLLSSDAALGAAFLLLVLFLLALDLGLLRRTPRETPRETPRDPTLRESALWTGVWVGLAAAFGLGVTARMGPDQGLAFASAYLVEQSLSVDNMLVIVVIFAQFAVPPAAQRKALIAGVLGAVVLRTGLVLGGASLIAHFHAVTYLLGAVLVVTAAKLALGGGGEAERGGAPGADAPARRPGLPGADAPARRPGLIERLVRRVLPVAPGYDGTRFFTRDAASGRRRATPLLIVVLVIEMTDLVFALDSVPAVLGVTPDPFIALTSNLFAVLGLRSLFFVVSGLLSRLRYLQTGLVLILLFIGTKMLVSFAIEIPVAASLLVILAILGGAVAASLLLPSPSSSSISSPIAERPHHEQA